MKIYPRSLSGSINIPASKSFCHRAIIAASLAEGISEIKKISLSDDIQSTLLAMKALGSHIEQRKNIYFIQKEKPEKKAKNLKIDCSESASTLRFLIPISMLQEREVSFYGKHNLPKRPLSPYFPIFEKSKIFFSTESADKNLCISLKGQLVAGNYTLPGNVSSQFISGLLFALPLLEGDSSLTILSDLESKSYVDMTLDILYHFGIEIQEKGNTFIIPGNQHYIPQELSMEGDYSQAAFFLVANSLGSKIQIEGLSKNSKQGDKVILEFLNALEHKTKEEVLVLDGSQCPDIIPVLSLRAALTPGKTRIIKIERLRVKECDRLHATAEVLHRLGAKVKEGKDFLELEGVSKLQGNSVSSYGDHRMAMMIAIASTCCDGAIFLDNADCVSKSYPNFWKDFTSLGGEYHVG